MTPSPYVKKLLVFTLVYVSATQAVKYWLLAQHPTSRAVQSDFQGAAAAHGQAADPARSGSAGDILSI